MQTAGVGKERVYLDGPRPMTLFACTVDCLWNTQLWNFYTTQLKSPPNAHCSQTQEKWIPMWCFMECRCSSRCTNSRYGIRMFAIYQWINTLDYLNQPFISPRPWSVGRPTLEVSACVCATHSGVHQRSSCPCRSIMTQVPWSRLA